MQRAIKAMQDFVAKTKTPPGVDGLAFARAQTSLVKYMDNMLRQQQRRKTRPPRQDKPRREFGGSRFYRDRR